MKKTLDDRPAAAQQRAAAREAGAGRSGGEAGRTGHAAGGAHAAAAVAARRPAPPAESSPAPDCRLTLWRARCPCRRVLGRSARTRRRRVVGSHAPSTASSAARACRAVHVATADAAARRRARRPAAPACSCVDIDDAHADAVDLCRSGEARQRHAADADRAALGRSPASDHRLAGIEAGAEAVLAKPFDPEELLARVRVASRVSQYTSDLDSAAAIIMTVTAMIEARESSPGHCYRMANYATALGRAMHLERRRPARRSTAARSCTTSACSRFPTASCTRAAASSRRNTRSSSRIRSSATRCARTCGRCIRCGPIVRHHHERLDGSGYPDRLQGRRGAAAGADRQHRRPLRGHHDGPRVRRAAQRRRRPHGAAPRDADGMAPAGIWSRRSRRSCRAARSRSSAAVVAETPVERAANWPPTCASQVVGRAARRCPPSLGSRTSRPPVGRGAARRGAAATLAACDSRAAIS